MRVKFSVIIPIYNVEPYLRECIDSVLAQTYGDYELILVDDGSPDGCPAICDEYAAKDARIRVIHKPNGGLVSARQAGTEIARGEYVVCVDSDDCNKPAMLERAAALIAEGNPDVIAFGAEYFTADAAWDVHEPVAEGWYDRAGMERTIYPRVLMDANMTYMLHFLCGKIIRRSIYEPHQMVVDRLAGRLNQIYISTTNSFVQGNRYFAVREGLDNTVA